MRLARWCGLGAVFGALLAACVGDLDVDGVPWACVRDSQCGWRARCVDNVCVLVDEGADSSGGDVADTGAATGDAGDVAEVEDTSGGEVAPTVMGFSCEATLLATDPDEEATFTVFERQGDGRLMLRVEMAGVLPAEVPLPPGVAVTSLTAGPLLSCCEDPCCPPLP